MKTLILTALVTGILTFGLAGCKSSSSGAYEDVATKTDTTNPTQADATKVCPTCTAKADPAKVCAMCTAKASKCATCAAGKTGEAAWCDKCDKGYVDGELVKCKSCFVAKTGGPACQICAAKK